MARWMAAIATCALASAAGAEATDGFRLAPKLGVTAGPHHLDLGVEARYRLEAWAAFQSAFDVFHAFRTRFGAQYGYRDWLRLVAQGQHTAIFDLDADASGIAAVYRSNDPGGSGHDLSEVYLSQLFAELRPREGAWLRAGREFVRGGTYVPYEETPWRVLKATRVAQRLLGTVGWTHVERAYDGAHGFFRRDGHALHGYVLEPTTGVFEVERGYRRNRDVLIGGLDYTLEHGAWREDSELGAFFVAYEDDRDPDDVAGLFGEIEVYTLGARWLGIHDVGPGRLDLVLWGAFQLGDYVDEGPAGVVRERDQRAWAALAEVGYARPDLPAAPHLRAGVNYASGDDDPDDGTRTTFFNLLPTNHGYYGYLDQFAFQNLVDLLVQLRLRPLDGLGLEPFGGLGLELDYHRFWLPADEDFRWAGSGAFSRSSLGYVRNPSRGSHDAGHELDLTATLPVHRTTTLRAGYSRFWGGDVFAGQDADWFYAQLDFGY